MKKNVNTGAVTGIVLSFLLMSSIAVKNEFPPASAREELVFLLIFLGVAGMVFWISMNFLTKFLTVRLPVLSSAAVVAVITASILTGLGGFIYSS